MKYLWYHGLILAIGTPSLRHALDLPSEHDPRGQVEGHDRRTSIAVLILHVVSASLEL
jgi:hypothetical protein